MQKVNINRRKLLGHSCLQYKEIEELTLFLLLSSVSLRWDLIDFPENLTEYICFIILNSKLQLEYFISFGKTYFVET